MINGSLCRAARALVELTRERLAKAAKVHTETIENFERQLDKPSSEEIGRIQTALEDMGAVFIPEDERGVGVRLKFTKSEAKRIAELEAEGGITAPDNVL